MSLIQELKRFGEIFINDISIDTIAPMIKFPIRSTPELLKKTSDTAKLMSKKKRDGAVEKREKEPKNEGDSKSENINEGFFRENEDFGNFLI